ncbi:CLUMA_CG001069, isoform A [Clunio marinus]|uniref:CLUMA_CG001069, isoform A n=1 Tax=Clunio marinus TaxID=568069 RepID=A0A1J1HHB3_9DIPT|nr:CLUMA_CG001069, isoform A [Clunio marinus]
MVHGEERTFIVRQNKFLLLVTNDNFRSELNMRKPFKIFERNQDQNHFNLCLSKLKNEQTHKWKLNLKQSFLSLIIFTITHVIEWKCFEEDENKNMKRVNELSTS